MQSTEKVSPTENSDKSLSEWPTLSDVCNNAKKAAPAAVSAKNGKKGAKQNKSSVEKNGGYDSSKENEALSEATVNGRGARKKGSSRTKWVPVPIVPQPYKKRGFGRSFYESRAANGEKKNDETESNGSANGSVRGYSRFRGKRGGRGYSHSWKPRQEATSRGEADKDSTDLSFEAECYYNNAVYYDPFLHNMYASALRDKQLKKAIRLQIEYYFSEDNLVKDIFVRRKMDAQGYVPLTLISTFHRVKNLTDDLDTIIEAVKDSSKLEMIDNVKVRPIVDPLKWPLPDTFPGLRSDVPAFVPGQPYIAQLIDGIEGMSFGAEDEQYPQSPDSMCLTPDQVADEYVDDDRPLVSHPFYTSSISPPEQVANEYVDDDRRLVSHPFYTSSVSPPEQVANEYVDDNRPLVSHPFYTSSVSPPEQVANDYVDDDRRLVSHPFYTGSVSPPEHNIYFTETAADLYVNRCGEFFSGTPSPEEPVNGFEYYAEPISNGVIYFAPASIPEESPVVNGTNAYYSSSPDDALSTGTENSAEESQEVLENNSPEPTR